MAEYATKTAQESKLLAEMAIKMTAIREQYAPKLKPLQGLATESQIEAWKQQYGEVFELQVEGKVCYLKPINRAILKMIASIGQNGVDIAEKILENCWIGGDEAIKNNDNYFLATIDILTDMLNTKYAVLKKK